MRLLGLRFRGLSFVEVRLAGTDTTKYEEPKSLGCFEGSDVRFWGFWDLKGRPKHCKRVYVTCHICQFPR